MREASKRVLALRPFDVQLIGGMILHEGQIAEMRTGEGKTLVAVLPAYLNALTGGTLPPTPTPKPTSLLCCAVLCCAVLCCAPCMLSLGVVCRQGRARGDCERLPGAA